MGKVVSRGLAAAFALAVVALVGAWCAGAGAEEGAQGDEMKIYGIHLKMNSGATLEDEGDNLGDSVLVESNGEYLLMDTGDRFVSDSVVKYLKGVGVKKLDVYISHMHTDHAYGIGAILDNFDVGTVYLPDRSIGAAYVSESGATIDDVYTVVLNQMGAATKAQQVVYLKKGESFDFGSVHAEVLGPVGKHSMKYSGSHGDIGKPSGHYLNNCSLTTKLTSGKTTFLTTGDIEEEEEKALVKEYGSKLKADILKIPHHGTNTSSTSDFLKYVKPTWSFAENSGYAISIKTSTAGESYEVSRSYQPLQRYHEVGFAYLVGGERASFIAQAQGGTVKLFRDADNDGKAATGEELSGKVAVKGDGVVTGSKPGYYGDNTYFLDSKNKPKTGIFKKSGKWYSTSKGGVVQQGSLKKLSGKYVYWPFRKYNGKGEADSSGKYLRVFTEGTNAMAVGVSKVYNPQTKKTGYFMFDPDGYRVALSKAAKNSKFGIYTLGDKNYAVTKAEGSIYNYTSSTKNLIMGNQTVKVKKGVIVKSKKSGTGDANLKKVTMGKATGVKAKAGTAKVTVTWKKTSKAKGYYVLRSTEKSDGYRVIKDVTKGSTKKYVDKAAKSGKTYYYKVQAYKDFQGCKFAGKASAAKKATAK